ncbi:ABC transporter ATP-binding protein [Microvirga antarctica]|uniref:ABC transporter ATP-binding protein n=1 Tax=Microvirga antarctica TaxID=2819233 RepID=UPI001B305B28|nr:ABC transporter ATP-binding protein [Microvirga antarctica]
MNEPLLDIRRLTAHLQIGQKRAELLSDISLTVHRGERLGIVGESGCGKSLTALAVMGLLPARMTLGGSILFDGSDLARIDEAAMCDLRGRRIAMVFQEPMTALNPIKSIGAQIAEGIRLHLGASRAVAEDAVRRLLDRVGLPAPRFNGDLYPHQLSGGQRQRVMIALALACEPDLLIADEPTTALDVTVQAQILDLIDDLVDETGMALILITHDLGVVSEMTERMVVMYAGRIVESGRTEDVFRQMSHPYTRGLFSASPHGAALVARRPLGGPRRRLASIPGVVPDPTNRPSHCAFADRCGFAQDDCRAAIPPLSVLWPHESIDHAAACFHPQRGKVPA